MKKEIILLCIILCSLLGASQTLPVLNFGDTIYVEIEKDVDIREVIVPDDVSNLLNKNPEAKAFYEKLSYTHKKEYIRWIESAKKKETRLSRIEKFLKNMIAGIKNM